VVEHEPEQVLVPVRHGDIETGQPQGLEAHIQKDLGLELDIRPRPKVLQGSQQELPVLIQVAHQFPGVLQAGLEGATLSLELPELFLAPGERFVLLPAAEELHGGTRGGFGWKGKDGLLEL
jgi:hypothetical protein